jgi:hypothetical protein
MFENLYLHEGIFYAITSDPDSIPPVSRIISAEPSPTDGLVRQANEDRWQTMSPSEASEKWGTEPIVANLGGTTVSPSLMGLSGVDLPCLVLTVALLAP